jgi:hypothetical protein
VDEKLAGISRRTQHDTAMVVKTHGGSRLSVGVVVGVERNAYRSARLVPRPGIDRHRDEVALRSATLHESVAQRDWNILAMEEILASG